MENKKIRRLPIVIALIMLMALVAIFATFGTNKAMDSANALDEVSYTYCEDLHYKSGSVTEYTVVTSSTYNVSAGWYYVPSDVTIANNQFADNISGTINLIIADGAKLTLDASYIHCDTLNVYGQSQNLNNHGTLEFVNIKNNSPYKYAVLFTNGITLHCVNLSVDSHKHMFHQVGTNIDSEISFYKSRITIDNMDNSVGSGDRRVIYADKTDISIIDSEYTSNTKSIEYEFSFGKGNVLIDNSTVTMTSTGGSRGIYSNNYGSVMIQNNSNVNISDYSMLSIGNENLRLSIFGSYVNLGGYVYYDDLTTNAVSCFYKDSPGSSWTRVSKENLGSGSHRYVLFKPALPEIEIANVELTYNGEAQTPVVSPSLAQYYDQNITFKYKLSANDTYGTMPTFTGIQTNTTVYFEASLEGYDSYEGNFSVSVIPATISVSIVQKDPLTYNGQPQVATVTATPEISNGQNVTFTYSDDEYGEYTSAIPAFTESGDHEVFFKANANYHEEATGSFYIKIGKEVDISSFFGAKASYVNYFDSIYSVVQKDYELDEDYDINASFSLYDDNNHSDLLDLTYTVNFTLPTVYDPEKPSQPAFDPAYTRIYRLDNENHKVVWANTIDAEGKVTLNEYKNGEKFFIRDTRPIVKVKASAVTSPITYKQEAQYIISFDTIVFIDNPITIDNKVITSYDDIPSETKLEFTNIFKAFSSYDNNPAAGEFSIGLGYDRNYQTSEDYNKYSVPGYRVVPSTAGTLVVNKKVIGIEWGSTNLKYNGSAQAPEATATGTEFGDEVEFTITGKETDIGTGYTATITGISNSNYALPTTNLTCGFSISQGDLDFTISIADWEYEQPQSNIIYSGTCGTGTKTAYVKKSSDPDSAYQLMSSSYPTEIGDYVLKVTIDETTEYAAGEETTTFSIKKKSINPSVSIDNWAYGETANTPTITGNTDNGAVSYFYKLTSAEDTTYSESVPTVVGAYTIKAVISETETYAGKTVTNTFSITAKDLGDADVTTALTGSAFTYDGTEKTVTFTVTYKETTLVEGEDFEVLSYSDVETDAGNYTVTIQGKGNYTGTKEIAWSINPYDISSGVTASYTGSMTYNGSAQTVGYDSLNVVWDSIPLDEDDFTIGDGKSATDKGDYTLSITGKGNFTGTISGIEWSIAPATLSLTIFSTSKEYGEEPSGPYYGLAGQRFDNLDDIFTLSSAVTATSDVGTYDIIFTEGSRADNYTISVTPGTYTVVPYKITADDMAAATITANAQGVTPVAFAYSETSANNAVPYINEQYTINVVVTKYERTITLSLNNGVAKDADSSLTSTIDRTTYYGYNGNTQDEKANFEVEEVYAVHWSIAKAAISVTINNLEKVYHADTEAATAVVSSGTIYETGSEAEAQAKVFTVGHQVELTSDVGTYDITLTEGSRATNYNITITNANEKGIYTVTPFTVGISWGDSTFTYDGSAKIPTATATNVFSGDTVTFVVEGEQINAGTDYTATITGISNSNYALPGEGLTCEFTIEKATPNFTASMASWIYGNETPNTYLIGDIKGDGTKRYYARLVDDPNEDNWRLLYASGVNKYPIDAGNYVLKVTSEQANNYNSYETYTNFSIYTKQIVVSNIKVDNKIYDGTTNATFNYTDVVLTGNLDGSDLSVVAQGTFENKNVGEDKVITITSLALAGAKKDNYVLAEAGQQTSTTANITVKEIVVSNIKVDNKNYDGTTDVTFNYEDVVLTGNYDGENLSVIATGAFVDKNVGEDKVVTITSLELIGDEKDNYVLANADQQTSAPATISAIPVKVTGLTVADRVYNGNNAADVICDDAVFTGIIAGDELTVSTTGTFADKNVGVDKTITFGELVLSGEDAGNYLVANDSQATTTATIIAKEIVVSGIAVDNKIYDATTNATFNYDNVTLDGNLDGENLSVVAIGAFGDKNVGVDKVVEFTLILGGTEKDNYVLKAEGQQTSTTATITAKEIVVSGIAINNREYNGGVDVTFNYDNVALDGNLDGENLIVVVTGTLEDKNIGTGKVVEFATMVLDGPEAQNYVLKTGENVQQASATVDINAKAIVVTIVNKTTIYGETPVELEATTEEGAIEAGDTAPYTLYCEVTSTSNVGFYNIVGTDVSDNYAVTFSNEENAYEVTKKEITATAENKVINYEKDEPTYTFIVSEVIPDGVLDELTERVTLICDVDTSVAGRYTIVLAFKDGYSSNNVLQNYAVTLVNAVLKVNRHYEIDDLTVDGLDPDYEYEVNIVTTTPENNNNIKKTDISITVKNNNGDDYPYEGEADLTIKIPELIDPSDFDLFEEDENGNETPIDPDDYDITENGEIVIHYEVPVRFVFKNKKGQIFVKADDKKIHDGDSLPTYTFTITGWTVDGAAISSENIATVKAAVVGSTNYTLGKTGLFDITTAFAQGKEQYTVINGFRVLLEGGKLSVLPKVLSDDTVEVTFDNEDDAFDLDISIEVEIKTDLNAEEKAVDYQAIAAKFVDRRSEISAVYDVKLLRTEIVNGVETTTEIQPEDIKPGTTIIIKMAIPENLIGRKFHILHIHSEDDIEYVNDAKVEVKDGYVYVKTDRLSEFAFVNLKDSEEMGHKSFCLGWLLFILDCLMLVYLVIHILLKRRKLLGLIGLIASALVVAFGVIVICLHVCIITIVAFILAVLIFLAFLFLFLLGKKKDKEEEEKEEEVVEKTALVVAYVGGEPTNKDCYVIHPISNGSFVYALYDHDGEIIAYSTEKFASIEDAKASIAISRSTGEVVNCVENRTVEGYEEQENPKFEMYYANVNEIYFGLDTKDGKQIMHSVAYLNTNRCTKDLERAFVLVKAQQIVISDLTLEKDVNANKGKPIEKPIVKKEIKKEVKKEVKEEPKEETPIVETKPTNDKAEEFVSEGLSLSETLDVAKHTSSHSIINKKHITNYLKKYGEEVELNNRDNYTKTGLPLADTHYAVGKDGKRCFIYVYEIGTTVLLLRLNKAYADKLIKKHDNVSKSAFPKSKTNWYSLVIDDTFSNEEIEKIIDDAYEMAK